MIKQCRICQSNYFIPYHKGMSLTPDVCSAPCFIACLSRKKEKIKAVRIVDNPDVNGAFKSFYENKFAKWAGLYNIKWLYEPHILWIPIKEGRTILRYIPDFYLPDFKTYIEVKGGIWESSAYAKSVGMKTLFKDYYFVITPQYFQLLFERSN